MGCCLRLVNKQCQSVCGADELCRQGSFIPGSRSYGKERDGSRWLVAGVESLHLRQNEASLPVLHATSVTLQANTGIHDGHQAYAGMGECPLVDSQMLAETAASVTVPVSTLRGVLLLPCPNCFVSSLVRVYLAQALRHWFG